MRRLLALFFIIYFAAGCSSEKTPKGIIPSEKMVDVLTDFHIAEGYVSTLDTYVDTVEIAKTYRTFYKKYGIDSLQLRKSIEYYSESPKQFQEMYQKVEAKVAALQKQETKNEEQRQKLEEKKRKAEEAPQLKQQGKPATRAVDSQKTKALKVDSLRDHGGPVDKQRN